MSWHQSTDDEAGHFVAKNAGTPSAHLPFLTVYDRTHVITLRYFQARTQLERAVQGNELLWKQAWKQASAFPKSNLSYRAWLLELADGILASQKTNSRSAGVPEESVDSQRTQSIQQALLKLSADRRKVFCLRAKGASEAEVFSTLGIDKSRGDHWLALASAQLQTMLEATP